MIDNSSSNARSSDALAATSAPCGLIGFREWCLLEASMTKKNRPADPVKHLLGRIVLLTRKIDKGRNPRVRDRLLARQNTNLAKLMVWLAKSK